MTGQDDTIQAIREPSLVDALIPLVFMIVLLTWSIVLFGIDAAGGPLQVALLLSAVVGAVVAHKNGHCWERLAEEVVKGISLAMSAILILLMVGALIGVWNMSGTIATVVYYGIKYINPAWFYFAAALLTGLIGIVTGSSWTTAATLGVAFIGMARVIDLQVRDEDVGFGGFDRVPGGTTLLEDFDPSIAPRGDAVAKQFAEETV